MAIPTVAIVGRPNVGKSTLFNRIIGKRMSIVDDAPGVTRDRIYSEAEWVGKNFILIDTGGLEPKTNNQILQQIKLQAELAISSANVIVFVTDIKSGVTSNDKEISNILQKSGKPVVLCVNKCDSIGEPPIELYEFYNLAHGDPCAVSSIHGYGIGDLLDNIFAYFPDENSQIKKEIEIKIAVVGRPNAGKSSLINKLTGEQRVIVSDVAGTTRDAVDTTLKHNGKNYVFIDTAGIRRKSKVLENIERYSVLRAHMAIDRADVCVIMIDANEGFAEQDSKIAGYAHEQGKSSIIAINKWDLIKKDTHTMNEFSQNLKNDFSFMSYAPFIYLSAKTGQRINNLYDMIDSVNEQNNRRISTGSLNDFLVYATARVQPPSDKGKRLKIYYITQASTKPPTFVMFVNNKDLFHFSYQRYLENKIRETFALKGTPIRIIVRERGK
ncbi:MAG: ribosome biogenesis GTPase Der, partial [Oscillospiraceae bacterium]|nr:ribosome biogenesis GTPase Der [Oscillospiraceae bacterium]